jgi:hypothetical protein
MQILDHAPEVYRTSNTVVGQVRSTDLTVAVGVYDRRAVRKMPGLFLVAVQVHACTSAPTRHDSTGRSQIGSLELSVATDQRNISEDQSQLQSAEKQLQSAQQQQTNDSSLCTTGPPAGCDDAQSDQEAVSQDSERFADDVSAIRGVQKQLNQLQGH